MRHTFGFLALLGAVLALAAPPSPVWGQIATASRPSFSCAKARAGAERMICADAELSRLDRIVSDLFAETRSLLLNAEQGAEADKVQRAWLQKRNRCTSLECLRQAHFTRIIELAQMLPADT